MKGQIVKLGDLFQIGSSKRVLKSQWKAEGVPFYRGREVTRLAADGFVENELFISEEHFTELAEKSGVPQAGDIVITAIGTIGNAYIVRESDRFYFKDASVLWMKRTADISSEFIHLWLQSLLFFDQLDKGNGATVDTLTIQKLQSLRLSVPPLPEQHRIVALLDEAFDGIATAKANAEQNLQNARALFESHLQSVFTERGDGWVEKRLDELFRIGSSKRVLKSQWKSEGVPFYRGREVTKLAADGHVNNELFISEEHYAELSKQTGVPTVGDIVITAIGTIGNAHIVRDEDRFYFKDASVLWLKRTAEISSEFTGFWLKSAQFFDQLDRGNGATVDTLTIQRLQSMKINVPSISVQQEVVSRLSALSAETQCLESHYQRKLAALDELKQSLLHQAFSGKL